MPPQLLLLLLLGPGSSLGLREAWEDGAKGAPSHLLARGRRQAPQEEDFYANDEDNEYEGTDPPEELNSTGAGTQSPRPQAVMGASAGPGAPTPAPLEVTTGDSAGPDTGGATIGTLGTELATPGIPVTLVPLTKELVTTIPPTTEAPSTEGALSTEQATTEALSMGSAVTEAMTMQPASTEDPSTIQADTEALSTSPAATETPPTSPAATEAPSTSPAATEAPSTSAAATEAQPVKSIVIEALSTEPAATEAPSTEPRTTETLFKDPATTEALSTQPATTRGLTTALPVPSDPHRGTTMAVSNSSDAFIKQWKNSQGLSPRSSASPSPVGALDYMPVRHCLLAIFLLALVATTFLVCTVVLAVRLSRRKHMYPVRSYSPTEMVCISALLPDGGDGPAATANGSLPATKRPGLKEGSGGDHDGDDLTLHSFLP